MLLLDRERNVQSSGHARLSFVLARHAHVCRCEEMKDVGLCSGPRVSGECHSRQSRSRGLRSDSSDLFPRTHLRLMVRSKQPQSRCVFRVLYYRPSAGYLQILCGVGVCGWFGGFCGSCSTTLLKHSPISFLGKREETPRIRDRTFTRPTITSNEAVVRYFDEQATGRETTSKRPTCDLPSTSTETFLQPPK